MSLGRRSSRGPAKFKQRSYGVQAEVKRRSGGSLERQRFSGGLAAIFKRSACASRGERIAIVEPSRGASLLHAWSCGVLAEVFGSGGGLVESGVGF